LAQTLGVIGCGIRSSRSDDVLLETLLPRGKVDRGLRTPEMPLDLHSIAADARLLEEIGDDGLVVEETKHDPFILLALAAQTTRSADRERPRQLACDIQPEGVARARRTILGAAA
jgi:hypothetical protein